MALQNKGHTAGRRGLGATALLYVALAAMAIDHAAWAFLPPLGAPGVALHFIGRAAGPLLFFLLVEYYYSSPNIFKAQWRALVYAALCWPVFVFYLHGLSPGVQGWLQLGLPFTLFLGLLALRVRHEVRNAALRTVLLVALTALSLLGDWPVFGLLFVLVFDVWRGDVRRRNLAAAVLILVSAIPASLQEWPFAVYQLGQFVPLLLLQNTAGSPAPGKRAQWLFVLFYPLHLALLGVLKLVLNG